MATTDHHLSALDGSPDVLAAARGKVALFVNVASQCGLTPQYTGMQQLQETYGPDRFTVIGFPCNQFGAQEPGTAEEIGTFCETNYNVTFPMTEKIEVNGDARSALYAELTEVADQEGKIGDIGWNFEKFVIGADGSVVARFSPMTAPDDPALVAAIEGALA